MSFRPAVFDRHVFALHVTGFFEALAKCAQTLPKRIGRRGVKITNHRRRRLLRDRRQRPRGRRTAEQADELPSPHAGHGLTFDNVIPIAAIPQLAELNIGHFLVGEAIFEGLGPVVQRMRMLMDEAR